MPKYKVKWNDAQACRDRGCFGSRDTIEETVFRARNKKDAIIEAMTMILEECGFTEWDEEFLEDADKLSLRELCDFLDSMDITGGSPFIYWIVDVGTGQSVYESGLVEDDDSDLDEGVTMSKYKVKWTDNSACAHRFDGHKDHLRTFTVCAADDKDALLNALQTILDDCGEDDTEWDQKFIDKFRDERYDFKDVEEAVMYELDPYAGYPFIVWIKQNSRVVYDSDFDEEEDFNI